MRLFVSQVIECDNRLLTPGDPRLVLLRTNQKFLLVPIAFIGLRIWDIIVVIVFGYIRVKDHQKYDVIVYLDVSGMCACICPCVCCVCCLWVHLRALCICLCTFICVVCACTYVYVCIFV